MTNARKEIIRKNAGLQLPSYTTKELKSHLRNDLPEGMKAKIEAALAERGKEGRGAST